VTSASPCSRFGDSRRVSGAFGSKDSHSAPQWHTATGSKGRQNYFMPTLKAFLACLLPVIHTINPSLTIGLEGGKVHCFYS
jgi:hypothetical protein